MSSDNFDGDGRKGADGTPAWDGSEDVVVPDDISELESDIRAYHREQRAVRRRARLEKLTLHNRFGFTLPIIVTVLVLVAAYTVVMLVVASPRPQAPRPVPLASSRVAIGKVGGLVPDVTLHRAQGITSSLRAIRPAVLFLTPAGCDCNGAIRSLATAAEHNRLGVTLIGNHMPSAPKGISSSLAVVASEPTGHLLNMYHVSSGSPVAVLVQPDGIVRDVFTDLPSAADLDDAVDELVRAG